MTPSSTLEVLETTSFITSSCMQCPNTFKTEEVDTVEVSQQKHGAQFCDSEMTVYSVNGDPTKVPEITYSNEENESPPNSPASST